MHNKLQRVVKKVLQFVRLIEAEGKFITQAFKLLFIESLKNQQLFALELFLSKDFLFYR